MMHNLCYIMLGCFGKAMNNLGKNLFVLVRKRRIYYFLSEEEYDSISCTGCFAVNRTQIYDGLIYST